MAATQLPLRDVHLPPDPGWWPPAPGWWLLAGVVLALVAAGLAWALRRRRRRQRWLAQFDAELAAAGTPAQQLATLSALLRRAARRGDPKADRLQGEAWLRLLDGRKRHDFSAGIGRVLLDGGFQRSPPVERLPQVRDLARRRFLELMAARR
jgi:hypothetical protein